MLGETLESFLLVERPADTQCEVLVVDNNSNDATAATTAEFQSRIPELFRYIKEPVQGLSFARNTGIRSSQAALIAFVDDDVLFDRNWLVEILKPFEQASTMCVGGRSIPQFEGSTPEWITTDILGFYGSTNSGEVVKRMTFPEHPFGLNMVFRREVFGIAGVFNCALGRKKRSLLSNEEKEIFYRIDRAGLPVVYTPHALVHHRIPEARTSKAWVLKRYYYQGVSDVAFRQSIDPFGKLRLIREAVGKMLFVAQLGCTALSRRVTGRSDAKERFRRQAFIYYVTGMAMCALTDAVRGRDLS